MGTYVYTLRKREVTLHLPDGGKTAARLCCYAYKPFLTFPPAWARKREASFDAAAGRAFETYTGGYVIDASDPDKGVAGLHGAYVYTGMTRGRWADSGPFPGTPVGIVRVVGKRAYLTMAGDWKPWTVNGTTVMRRTILKDGKFQSEAA